MTLAPLVLPDHELFVAPIDVYLDAFTMVEPDLVVVPKTSVGEKRLTLPVDLAIEVLLPSSQWTDRSVKFGRYEQAGIAGFWLVDPVGRRIDRFVLSDGRYADASHLDAAPGLARLPDVEVLIGWARNRPNSMPHGQSRESSTTVPSPKAG